MWNKLKVFYRHPLFDTASNGFTLVVMVYISTYLVSTWHYSLLYAAPPLKPGVTQEEYNAAKEYEEEYGKSDFGGRSPDLPICECNPCRCKDCECHLGAKPNYQSGGKDMPGLPKPIRMSAPKPNRKVDSVDKEKLGLFRGRESTVPKKAKMWLTVRTYINSDGYEDPWCDTWIIVRDGAVLQGLLHGCILQERAEQIISSSSLPVRYEVLDFSPKRDSINRPINPEPFQDLEE